MGCQWAVLFRRLDSFLADNLLPLDSIFDHGFELALSYFCCSEKAGTVWPRIFHHRPPAPDAMHPRAQGQSSDDGLHSLDRQAAGMVRLPPLVHPEQDCVAKTAYMIPTAVVMAIAVDSAPTRTDSTCIVRCSPHENRSGQQRCRTLTLNQRITCRAGEPLGG
jgi:hypothetical protein